MSLGEPMVELRTLRAPVADREILIFPPRESVADLLRDNRAGHTAECELLGRPLAEIAAAAQRELVALATHYTQQYRNLPGEDTLARLNNGAPLLVAGHQAELFHPGVWAKNFALSALAQQHRAVAINLVVDSDLFKQHGIRVPSGSVDAPYAAPIPFEKTNAELPTEEHPIFDASLWASFDRRVQAAIRPLVPNPLIETFWPQVLARTTAGVRPGLAIAQARHQLEGEWGQQTLEVPLSSTCQTESFAWFAAHLLANLPRFVAVHNAAVVEYRQTHHLRSNRHPVPELVEDEQWLEAPFWIWSAQQPQRQRVFVKCAGDGIVVSDRQNIEFHLPLCPASDPQAAIAVLLKLPAQGIRLRTRALTTTLWARLFLSDLFVHGLGGAKYDQVTDQIMSRFYGLRPPSFLTVTATLHLPVPKPGVPLEQGRQVERQLRDVNWNPQRHLPAEPAPAAAQLAAEKARWIESPDTPVTAVQRMRAIRQISAALQPHVESRREELLQTRTQLQHDLAAQRVLAAREYAFCLFPADYLRDYLTTQF